MNELERTLKLVRGNVAKSDSRGLKNSTESSSPSGNPLDTRTLSEVLMDKDISKPSKGSTSEIRHDLVNKFRNVLQDGTYSIKADEIADKIVQKIRDNKNHLAL